MFGNKQVGLLGTQEIVSRKGGKTTREVVLLPPWATKTKRSTLEMPAAVDEFLSLAPVQLAQADRATEQTAMAATHHR